MFKSTFYNNNILTKQADMRNSNVRSFLRSIVLLVGLVISTSTLIAQTDHAIGTGTTGNGNTDYPSPLQDFYEGSRMQFLYRASELTAAGMTAGNITALKFNVLALTTSTGAMPQMEQMQISIGGTTTASLSANSWEGGTNLVYGPVDYMATIGINTFTFTTPFYWNGTDNILIEICNGDPANTSSTTYTGNPSITWTTNLSFNGSHSYRADNLGNLCGAAITTNFGLQTTRPNIIFTRTNSTACTGTPAGGTATSSTSAVCSPSTSFTLSVTGSVAGAGITYQWQSSTDNINWTNISGATSASYAGSGITATTYFRRITSCGSASSNSSSVMITSTPPSYAAIPFTESFENTWSNACDTRDVPNNFWRNTIPTGNTSWRRNDDPAGGNWSSPNSGAYTPPGSDGAFSARFHSFDAPVGSRGALLLYINAATSTPSKRLIFDHINTSGSDSLVISISTNGGTSFTRLDSLRTSPTWRSKTILFSSASATTVLHFEGVSDFGGSDIGIDNILVTNFAPCSGTPDGGTTVSTSTAVCPNTPFTLSVTGSTDASGLTYQWEISTNGGTTWTAIAGATGATYTSTGITQNTSFRRRISCGTATSTSTPVAVNMNAPAYAPLPYQESFENTWINGCNTRDIPNNFWRNTPSTGNPSWRRNDDGSSAAWTTATGGAYTPTASVGTFSARFHSDQAISGSKGQFDLYFNANTSAQAKRLSYDFINTNGNDSLTILLSTNGGTSFVRLDSARTAAAWTTKTILFNSLSATTVIRFEATSDNGTTDIGLDNINIIDFANCAGTPNAGTAITSAASVCTEPFTVSLTGSSSASGLTYQWQRSIDNGATWTNIPGATSISYTTTQVRTTWYRAIVTCTLSNQSATSTHVVVTSPQLARGVYTINSVTATNIPARTFQSFNDAYNFIKCGIDSAVLFNVINGPYNEQLIMNNVPGTSVQNTVTFKGNGTAAIGFASTNTNERAVIKLRGTRHIIFDSLIINANAGTFGYGVQLMPNTDSNIVRNCTINSSLTATTQNYAGIVVNFNDPGPVNTGVVLSDDNVFDRNTIIGGYYGITLVATFNGGANGNNRITNNNIRDFYNHGIYVVGSFNTLIEANRISRPTRASVIEFNGISFFTQKSTGCIIARNRIFNPYGGATAASTGANGIHFNASDGSVGAENQVVNNLIYNMNGQGSLNGIINNGSDYVSYLHNTISLDEASSTSGQTTRGFFQTTTAAGLFFYNNLISITRGGTGTKHAIYLATGLLAGADYNNYYLNAAGGSNFVGFYTANRATLNDWRTATNHDLNSLSTVPAYVDPANGNYTPGNAGLNNQGGPVGVPNDINNAPRDPNTPDIGAYEFTPPACATPPVNGTTSLSATTICQNQPVFLTLNIGAYGAGQTFQWQTSTTVGGPYNNLGGPLATPDTTILSTTTLYFRAAVGCGSTVVFSDPVLLTVTPALPSGTYTINKNGPASYVPGTPGGNFVSFNAAKAAMSCGIFGGPVVFNVVAGSGPYAEQLRLDTIAGVTAVNTITFNGNGNTLSFSSANTTERATLKLSRVDHIIFDSLVIDGSQGSFGYAVQLINNADSNTFRRCTFQSSLTATANTHAGVVINSTEAGPITTGPTLCDSNRFERNRFIGGFYGATVVGSATAVGAPYIANNTFIGNTITDYYSAGMYVAGTLGTLIEGNTFSRPTRATSAASVYGIQVAAAVSNRLTISKNRFTRMLAGAPTSTTTVYGVHHESVDAASGNEAVVSNNVFYRLEGNGSQYALYNTGSNNVSYFHNTIAMDDRASTSTAASAAFYQTTNATGIQFKNNMITITRGGTGAKHAIYVNTTASEIESNWNNFYVSATNAHVGFYTTSRTTLAQWRAAAAPDDTSSLDLNPLYADSANGNFRPQLAQLDNKGKGGFNILTDITNRVRNTTTPDIGAYEFDPIPCDVPPTAGTATVTPSTGVCLETPIRLNITGHSALGSITFQWQHSTSASGPWENVSGVQYFPQFDTVATTRNFYRAIVTCGTSSTITNVVQVNLNNLLLAGTYSINPANPPSSTNFQSFQAAVNALLCGITGPVRFEAEPGTYTEQIRIPYVPGMSSVNTVTFTSRTGVASSVNLAFASTVAATNYTLRLDSARHFTFINMSVSALNPVNGRAVELTNGASFNNFIRCNISAPTVTNPANTAAGIYAATFRGRNIVLQANRITGGANGIYFAGTSATNLALAGHVIDSNIVSGTYSHGINVQNANRIRINHNNVALAGALGTSTAGIYTLNADSSTRIQRNTVTINGVTTGPSYGLFIQATRALMTDSAIVSSNTVMADSNNTQQVNGLTVTLSRGVSVVNNVIGINSSGSTTYGLQNQNNTDEINYYNNTVNITANTPTGYAGFFTQSATSGNNVRNNIFSNRGGGRALFVNNPAYFSADYNMLYTTGPTLVTVSTGIQTDFPTLLSWKKTWNWDRYSIVYNPAFISNRDLRPDLANPDVWAIHGRGVQIRGNTFDFNGNNRPDALTEGVPDLGAFEFFPTSLPTVLTATPAVPQANAEQIFTYGTDTVMKITWRSPAPPSIQMRRFSGVVPSGLPTGMDSMFFYTKVDIPGGGNYQYSAKLYYIDSWQGSIPSQSQLGLGRTTPSNAWVVGANSTVDVGKKEIRQEAIAFLDRFTGLVNPFAQPEAEDSSSNRGKDFWVGYQRTNGFSGSNGGLQQMVLYFGASSQPANVKVEIELSPGNTWVRNYFVPANSAIQSDFMPKVAPQDARLTDEGYHRKKGIHITSDVPIVAYAHTYESANSGATMLMPTSVWGYEHYTLSSRQFYSTPGSASVFHIVAKEDSTWVEINPTDNTVGGWVPNGGTQPNGSYLIKLNKGDAYQVLGAVLSGSEGRDLSGTYVKSIANAQGTCNPIAVFAGSTRTAIGCGTATGSNGDLIVQQIFPYQAWGNKYATAPTSNADGPNAGSNMPNRYRVLVKDPTTVVKRNGVTLTGLIRNRYYDFESQTADYIESNKPVLLAQFMPSSGQSVCPNYGSDGDPEMFYLSPIQQAIKNTQFYRNNLQQIDENFITLVIPTEGLQTLRIDGINYQAYPTTERFVYTHPNLPGYSVVTKKWLAPTGPAGRGPSTVESDFPFTGIVYGLGSVESYGYNIGTLVKNLNNLSSVNNVLNTGLNSTEYTCKGAPFTVTALLPLVPDSIRWLFSQVPNLSPSTNIVTTNPVPFDTVTVNGIDYYAFTITQQFTFDSSGIFNIPIQFYSQEIESCDKSQLGRVVVQVLPSPITDFAIAFPPGQTAACEGDQVRFTGDVVTSNGIALSQWQWTFHTGATATGQNTTFTYPTAGTFPVKLRGITADGCISDTTKNVVINARPVVNVVTDSVAICPNGSATFTVSNPQTGVTYNWYDVPTGGTILGTGTTFTANNVSPLPKSFYVEGVSQANCASVTRKRVTAHGLPLLAQPVVTNTGSTANTVTFSWTAVPNAIGYQVSVNNGPFVTPSSGATGLTHTVTGLGTLERVSIVVRAVGANSCQNSLSAPVTACTNSSAAVVQDSIAVCTGSDTTFRVLNPIAGFTYTWYTTPTGGTPVATGSSFTVTNIQATTVYYVQQSSPAGCTGTTRTRVVATVLQPLAPAVVTVTATTPNSITWSWNAVPGAATYQVSIDNGVTFTTPSSGATGLTHTVNNLIPLQQVTLIVRAVGSITCQNSLSTPVTGRTLPDDIFIPNSFTPNGDGLNDVLLVYGYTIQSMQFMIFNQWGEKIFESNNQSIGWNGTYKGKPQPSGVYIYVARFILKDGTVVNRKGATNLIR
jgi:trimeric autotransporter adhesin